MTGSQYYLEFWCPFLTLLPNLQFEAFIFGMDPKYFEAIRVLQVAVQSSEPLGSAKPPNFGFIAVVTYVQKHRL